MFSQMNYKWGAEIKKKGSDGMANAAIETFRSGDIMSGFVRELVQNSQDARLDNNLPLKIRMRLFSIDRSEIPEFEDGWIPVYRAVKKEWLSGYPGFFEKADEVLKGNKIMVLEYSDFNTGGLTGVDSDDKSSFSACVLSEGNSVEKSNDAGGSYGIGKNAVYGLSVIRTVLYSSLNDSQECIFQGVSKLASYKLNNNSYSSRVYLGQNNDELSSVRRASEIPKAFKRSEQGLSQFIIGANLSEEWIKEIISLVINNYFILLNNSRLVFELVDEIEGIKEILDHSNFEKLAEDSFYSTPENEQVFHVWPKICALNSKSTKADLTYYTGENLKDAMVVHFINDLNCGQNYVTYTRRGMHIFQEKLHSAGGIGYLNLVGVFYSDNQKVNSILRLMEPAAHDAWKRELLKDRMRESEDLNWAMELEGKIKKFIRENAKKFLNKFSSETHTISQVDELLKIGDSPSGIFRIGIRRSAEEDEETETTLKTGRKYEVDLTFSSLGENIVDGEFLDRPSGSSKRGGQPSVKGSGTKVRKGGTSSAKKKNVPAISYKCILKEEEEYERNYILIVKSPGMNEADIEIYQAGDRGSRIKPEVISVDQGSRSLVVEQSEESAIIRGVEFENGASNINMRIRSLSKAGIILQLVKIHE
jgi:hypothetical protein